MTIFGTHDPKTLEQFHAIEQGAEKAALMADGHAGYSMPIGGVAAYDNQVSVVGVGFDIACGNAAIRTDAKLTDLGANEEAVRHELTRLANEIAGTISFGMGRKNRSDDAPTDDPLFDDAAWDAAPGEQRHQ